MSDNILLDPVADGKPSYSKHLWAGIVLMLALAGATAYLGHYWDTVDSLLLAAWVYLVDLTRRKSWMRGYYAAGHSVEEPASPELDFEAPATPPHKDGGGSA